MYKMGAHGWLKHIDFVLCDVLSLQLAYVLAYVLRFDHGWFLYRDDLYNRLALILIIVDVLTCMIFNTMHNVLKRGFYREFAATVRHALLVFAMLTIYLVSAKISARYSRIVLYTIMVLHIGLGYVLRIVYKCFLRSLIFREKQRSLLLVTEEKDVAELVRNIRENMNDTVRIAGIVLMNRDAKGEQLDGISVVENLDGAAEYICREWIDEILVNVQQEKNRAEKLIRQCREMGVVVHECLTLEKSDRSRQMIEKFAGYTVVTTSVNYATPAQAFIKRVMDIVGGLIGCLIALIVIAVVGPMIKKQSPGPILYTQERVGENGRKFKFYKIRSMYLDADNRKAELMDQNRIADGMMFKLDFDPRIIGNEILPDGTKKTGIGAFIRNTSLDEFPQFFNVLKGDMSLVGTRPPTVDEWERYDLHHRMRLAMKPGLTGMWQVSGRSDIVDFEEVVKLDTQYICNWSLGLDMKILLKTIGMVVQKRGAM